MSYLPLVLVVASCQLDPEGAAASEYVGRLQPLVHENSLLSERVLFQAAAVYNEATLPADVGTAWMTEITPLAEHLHHQATYLEPPESWQKAHQELTQIWGERAQGYRAVAEGLRAADAEAWERGNTLVERARAQETEWFLSVNTRLQPLGVQIDAYP